MFCKRGKGSRIYSNRVRLIMWHCGRVKNFHLKELKCFQLDNIQIHSFPSSSRHHATDLICDRKRKKQKKIGIRSLEPCRVNPARLCNGDKRRKLFFFARQGLFQSCPGGSNRRSTFTVIGFEWTVVILQNEAVTSFKRRSRLPRGPDHWRVTGVPPRVVFSTVLEDKEAFKRKKIKSAIFIFLTLRASPWSFLSLMTSG